MIRKKQTIILFFGLLCLLSFTYAQTHLVILKNVSPGQRQSFHIIRQIGNEYITIIPHNQLQHMGKKQVDYSIIDDEPMTKCYFLIANSALKEPRTQTLGTILKRYDQFFLYGTKKEQEEAVRDIPARMERLDFTPLDFSDDIDELLSQPKESTGTNPLIKKIIDEVSIDTLRYYVKKLQSFKSRHSSSTENKNVVCPWLQDILKGYCDSVYLQSVGGSCGPNVIGVKYGKKNSSLSEYALIGGHMDGAVKNGKFGAAGADDNGTGTAAVLECARIFKNYSFENTVLFALFNGEESGLLGSKKMANDMKQKGHKVKGGVVTYDMLGHSTASSKNLVQLEGFDNSSANKNFVQKYMQGIVDTYTKMKTYQYLKGFGSDHVSFKNAGFVTILLIEREYDHPAYHKDFDTLDCPVGLNDMALFENITKTGTAAIADIAVPMELTTISANAISASGNTPLTVQTGKNNTLIIQWQEQMSSPLTVRIYSTNGKLIQSYSNIQMSQKSRSLTLPIQSPLSRVLSQGVYFIQLEQTSFQKTYTFLWEK